MTGYIQVHTAVENRDDAVNIARTVVEQRLAACAQVLGPVTSTYWWKGKVETAEEWLCFIKSPQSGYEELEAAIKSIHPYETPEIIATSIVAGNPEYLRWLDDETG